MKTSHMNFRCSPEEENAIREVANELGISVSDFIVACVKKHGSAVVKQLKTNPPAIQKNDIHEIKEEIDRLFNGLLDRR